MKSLLVFLAVIATSLAWHNCASEECSWPKPLLSKAPWRHQKKIDFNTEANLQTESVTQDVFKAGHTYLIMGNNSKFLCCFTQNNGNQYVRAYRFIPDVSCRFIASTLDNGKVSLRIVEGKYLQQVMQRITPTADAIIPSAQFLVEANSSNKWSGDHNVYLKTDKGKYWSIQPNSDYVTAYDNQQNDYKKLTVMEAR